MDKSGNFTIRTNPVDGTNKFSATIDWGDGNISFVKGNYTSSKQVFDAAMEVATKYIDEVMRSRHPNA